MSNKTLRASIKKIKSAPKLSILFFACIVLIAALTVDRWQKHKTDGCEWLSIGGSCIYYESATTPEARHNGLSNRDKLAPGSAMLFVFRQPDQQCFWMKDMRFNLDMIWLNQQKQIVKIMNNVEPSTYPQTFCADNTVYVFEVNAGDVNKYGLQVGQTLSF